MLQDFDLTPDRFPSELREALPSLWKKWLVFFAHGAKHALFSPSGGTGWLVLVGLFAALVNPEATVDQLSAGGRTEGTERSIRNLALCALLIGLIPVLASTIAVYQVLYMVPVMPLYAMGAAIGARFLATRIGRPRVWLIGLILLILPSAVMALREGESEARRLEQTLAVDQAGLSKLIEGDGEPPIFSDTPDFVAWTTGQPTVWVSREQFEALYAPGDSAAPAAVRHGLPPRARALTWFHENPRNPADRGGPASR